MKGVELEFRVLVRDKITIVVVVADKVESIAEPERIAESLSSVWQDRASKARRKMLRNFFFFIDGGFKL